MDDKEEAKPRREVKVPKRFLEDLEPEEDKGEVSKKAKTASAVAPKAAEAPAAASATAEAVASPRPATAGTSVPASSKGRGRPRKLVAAKPLNGPKKPSRGRGRPPKQKQPENKRSISSDVAAKNLEIWNNGNEVSFTQILVHLMLTITLMFNSCSH